VKSEPLTNYFGENRPREDFGRRSSRGGLISIGARIANAFVQIGKVVSVVGPQAIGALAALAMGFALRDTVFASIPTIPRAVFLTISYSTAYFIIVVGLFGVRTPLRVGRSVLRACVAYQ
jgi:hypothetical protein